MIHIWYDRGKNNLANCFQFLHYATDVNSD